MEFKYHIKFNKEYKKLFKKYKSLDEDLEKFKKVLMLFPCGRGEKHWQELRKRNDLIILKTRLSCAYLKKSSLRVIYAYDRKTAKIEFIEIYFKGEKSREDKQRIEEYLKDNPNS